MYVCMYWAAGALSCLYGTMWFIISRTVEKESHSRRANDALFWKVTHLLKCICQINDWLVNTLHSNPFLLFSYSGISFEVTSLKLWEAIRRDGVGRQIQGREAVLHCFTLGVKTVSTLYPPMLPLLSPSQRPNHIFTALWPVCDSANANHSPHPSQSHCVRTQVHLYASAVTAATVH